MFRALLVLHERQTWIKACLVAIRVANFPTPYWIYISVPQPRLIEGDMCPLGYRGSESLQGRVKEFVQPLLDKVAPNHLELDLSFVVGDAWGGVLPVTWNRFQAVRPEKSGRDFFRTVSSATCSLHPCLSWLVKAAIQDTSCEWIPEVMNCSLNEGWFLYLLKRTCPLLKKPSLNPTILDSF